MEDKIASVAELVIFLRKYFDLFVTKISTLSDQPFSLSPKNVIFQVIIMKFLTPGQNFGIFASPTKEMDTFLFEMSMK